MYKEGKKRTKNMDEENLEKKLKELKPRPFAWGVSSGLMSLTPLPGLKKEYPSNKEFFLGKITRKMTMLGIYASTLYFLLEK